MAILDEHAAFEWAEYNVPEEIRALPPAFRPRPSPLGRRVIGRPALAASRQASAGEAARDPFWLWARRPV
jgi:hypothetical protein